MSMKKITVKMVKHPVEILMIETRPLKFIVMDKKY